MNAVAATRLTAGRQIWNFARHFLEMCVAMCVGGAILALLIFAAVPALFGSPNLREQFPQLSLLAIAVILTLPMAGWMRFRGMAWRPIVEMSAVLLGLAMVWIGAVWDDVISSNTLQVEFGQFCGISCVGMFVVMLFRPDLYTGRTGHHLPHAPRVAHAS